MNVTRGELSSQKQSWQTKKNILSRGYRRRYCTRVVQVYLQKTASFINLLSWKRILIVHHQWKYSIYYSGVKNYFLSSTRQSLQPTTLAWHHPSILYCKSYVLYFYFWIVFFLMQDVVMQTQCALWQATEITY